MINSGKLSFIAAISLGLPGISFGHGDTDQPLFVAAEGRDRGNCQDRADPCQSVGYALKRAGKGGQIRVAAGIYRIENPEDLFHLVSGTIDVFGGFQFDNDFRPSLDQISTLTNIPAEFREPLRKRGFHVVADGKATNKKDIAYTQKLLSLNKRLQSSMSAAPCAGGSVNGLSCDSVDLLSHMPFSDLTGGPASAADVWGFVDLNTGREYAIAGFNTGTAVVDVTDATSPAEVAFIAGQTTTWRDIKVYQHFDQANDRWKAYAYVTSDASNDGLVIIDLSGLPHSVRRISYASDFSSAHNVYATNTDYSTGISLTGDAPALIIAGPNISGGQYRAYSLANPEAPQFVGDAGNAGYMHDASSMIITDARKDTQCINAATHCEVLLDFNENEIEIWDITDIGRPSILSATAYANASYIHSGWWSEDKQYLFVHDELDEQRFSMRTTLRVFSVSDLTNPVEVGRWSGPTAAIDHNGFIRGNRYYMSNYSRGLTILDISDPTAPTAVGNLDTYPFSDTSSFVGAWGAYPFFYSGNIAISDISSGLYMAEDRSKDVLQGKLSYARPSYSLEEGGQTSLEVNRVGGSTGSVTVDYEILAATADSSDFTVTSGLLAWCPGDNAARFITVAATNDGVDEALEHLIVRLVAPSGGATLGNDSTSNIYVSDPGKGSTIGFFVSSADVSETGFARTIVTAQRHGSAIGAVSVDYDISAADAELNVDFQGITSGTFNWEDGDATPKNIEFVVIADGISEESEFFELTMSNANGASLNGNSVIRINISDTAPVQPPVDPPVGQPGGNRGGGSVGAVMIPLFLIALLSRRRRISRKDGVG